MHTHKSPFMEEVTIAIPCSNCGNILEVKVDKLNFNLWYQGIISSKEAFPYLTEKERKMVVSRKCWFCEEEGK